MRHLRLLMPILFATGAAASDVPQPTFRAEQFIDSLGIAASPFDGAITEGQHAGYGTFYGEEQLLELGVRYYRTGLKNDLSRPDTVARTVAAWERYGIRPMLLIDPHKTGSPQDLVAMLKRYPAGCVAQVEMPNELNNKFPPQELNLKYDGKVDELAGAAYQRDYTAAMRADPAVRPIPVVCFTAIFTDHRLAKPCDAFDFANMHSYQGYDIPSSSLEPNVAKFNNIYAPGTVTKPFVPTECGYNVEVDQANHQGYQGNVRAQALNIPMLYAEYFLHGIARTYLFSLPNVDGYGLLESDHKTRRPSWYAVRNLIAELRDAAWDPAAKRWAGGDFTPRGLLFTTPGAPATVHTLTLQKHDGSYAVLLWNEVRNYDQGAQRDVINAPVPTTLSFQNLDSAEGELLTQDDAGAYRRTPVVVAGGMCTVPVPAAVSILRLKPASAMLGGEAAAVTGLSATSTENSATLSWKQPADAAGALVFRNGRCIATATGGGHTDRSSWLRPGLGYTYAVQAFDRAGRLSRRVELVVQTAPLLPDLAVTAFEPVPSANGTIQPGDQVSFRGTVRNIGRGATPAGLPVTITFSVDGKVVSWGGVGGPLAPGEERTFEATGGPGSHTWQAVAGPHTLRAWADDINRIPNEADKGNNIADRSLHVGPPAQGLLDARSWAASGRADLTRDGGLDWVAWGQGGVDGVVRKRGGTLIGALTGVGQGHRATTPGCPVALAWNDGFPTATASDDHAGLWGNGVGNGWSLSVPAGTRERTLTVYGSGIEGASGRFSATLSDGSAPAYVSTTWTGNSGMGNWAAAPGGFNAVFRLRFRAAAEGQRLDVEWTMRDEPNRFRGQIRLQAATLADE